MAWSLCIFFLHLHFVFFLLLCFLKFSTNGIALWFDSYGFPFVQHLDPEGVFVVALFQC